jgi:hypothetical protein
VKGAGGGGHLYVKRSSPTPCGVNTRICPCACVCLSERACACACVYARVRTCLCVRVRAGPLSGVCAVPSAGWSRAHCFGEGRRGVGGAVLWHCCLARRSAARVRVCCCFPTRFRCRCHCRCLPPALLVLCALVAAASVLPHGCCDFFSAELGHERCLPSRCARACMCVCASAIPPLCCPPNPSGGSSVPLLHTSGAVASAVGVVALGLLEGG